MEILKNIYAKIIIGLIGIVGSLLYILKLKDEKLTAHKAELQLADTKEKVKDIERDIRVKMDDHTKNKKQIDRLKKSLVKLEEKKSKMAADNNADIEEYWKNN